MRGKRRRHQAIPPLRLDVDAVERGVLVGKAEIEHGPRARRGADFGDRFGQLRFGELLAGDAGDAWPLLHKAEGRCLSEATGDLDDVVDVVAVEAVSRRGEDPISVAELQLVKAEERAVRRVRGVGVAPKRPVTSTTSLMS